MILITVQYIPIDFDVAFLRIKQKEIQLTHYQWAFFSHVYTSIFVLIVGVTQFSDFIREKLRGLHKLLGKLYIGLVLIIASPSGLIMAYYAIGGFWSKLSFCIQAILWFFFTYKAYRFVKFSNWAGHRNYMLRSYALTLSAISLRLLKWLMVSTVALPPMDTYKIVAWCGWILNLLIVEGYLLYNKNPQNIWKVRFFGE